MTTTSIENIAKLLDAAYPNPRSELQFSNDYELVIAVVLSAQCTDKKVNQVTPTLFSSYPSFAALAKAQLADIENIIRPVNYYKTKSKNIIALASRVSEHFQGKLPTTFDDLTSLPGVGRKTANVVLCEQGVTPALPVDTHVLRLANRLGFSTGEKPEEVEEDLKKLFPPETWHDLHHWLILHGRYVCRARRPSCDTCVIADFCPSRQ